MDSITCGIFIDRCYQLLMDIFYTLIFYFDISRDFDASRLPQSKHFFLLLCAYVWISVPIIFYYYFFQNERRRKEIKKADRLVVRGASCYTKGTWFEFQIRQGCKTVRRFIGGNGDLPIRHLHNKMVTTSGLSRFQKDKYP